MAPTYLDVMDMFTSTQTGLLMTKRDELSRFEQYIIVGARLMVGFVSGADLMRLVIDKASCRVAWVSPLIRLVISTHSCTPHTPTRSDHSSRIMHRDVGSKITCS